MSVTRRKGSTTLVYCADFETTVYKNQDFTEVWAAACCRVGDESESVNIFHSIGEQYEYFENLKSNAVIYYHNLKFDGSFWLWFLNKNEKMKPALMSGDEIKFKTRKDMPKSSYSYVISAQGQWYIITIKTQHGFILELRDSYKLLPFSLRAIGKSFDTKHKKLDMEYTGYRYAGCPITEAEAAYIRNDVLVMKEALEIMFAEGHTDLTIGACCLKEFKRSYAEDYDFYFPNLYEMPIDEKLYGSSSIGEYVRRSYRGGWCYVARGKEGKIYEGGCTLDVNSLYPSVMSSESGSKYPWGEGRVVKTNTIPDWLNGKEFYYFVRVRTDFTIKKDKLPFIQIKNSVRYRGNDMLITSAVYNEKTGKYNTKVKDMNGDISDTRVTLTMTETDWRLFNEHYNLYNTEILDLCYFSADVGFFDSYIHKYKKIKQESKGAKRSLAKLFLNSLYGKMAASTDSSFKVASLNANDALSFTTVLENDKKPGYIAIGSAITSYARNFTIRAAQQNYYGVDKPGFIYADTDSIHCDLSPAQLRGVQIHDTEFCHWKVECEWSKAIFTRQKTYIELVTRKDGKDVTPYYDIKCAGMPDKCKDLFETSMTGVREEGREYNEDEEAFLERKRTMEDFKVGLCVPGKLMPKQIKGGMLLVDSTYEMR